MFKRTLVAAFFAVVVSSSLFAAGQRISQPLRPMNAAELQLAIRKLGVVGSVLYIAAHPDDENTALLAYLSNERMTRTGYLSLTRGEGGQNLIGSEKGALLGVIRTQELLAARDVDGAEQYFTRAVDFGYSKSPEETLAIWGRDAVLSDVVRVIREFRPDVIITRFPTNGQGGHGQHTASAILAEEAFTAAADPKRFPEQLDTLKPWQAKRIFWNAWVRDGQQVDVSKYLSVDLGTYNALLGRSYNELAAQSRTFHKSQGFGSAERRGTMLNYFQHTGGEPATADILEGVDLSWNRIPGGGAVAAIVAEANRVYDPSNPSAVTPVLVRALKAIEALPPSPIVDAKRREALDAIRSAAGLWIDAVATSPEANPGSEVKVVATVVSRAGVPARVESIALRNGAIAPLTTFATPSQLETNKPLRAELSARLPQTMPYSHPQWLAATPDPATVVRPDAIASLTARATLTLAGEAISFDMPVVYRSTDPVHGELYRAVSVVPPATALFDHDVYLFPADTAKPVRVRVRSHRNEPLRATVRLTLPSGWRARPEEATIELARRGDEATAVFDVDAPAKATISDLGAAVTVDGATYAVSRASVAYEHIPHQLILPPASARLVRFDLKKNGSNIGYVAGSGDDVPDVLEQLGYRVSMLDEDAIDREDLSPFDAIVVGVRAYNTRPELRNLQAKLLGYVEKGGTLVIQYNTLDESLPKNLGPYPFQVSRDRVTDERAEVTLTNPAHPILTAPNRIVSADFEGWVQERGLYFPNQWDAHYETLFSSHDPGETAKEGGTLVAKYGKGTYIYTGHSWFRQLPAGVPGAIRMFVNMVSAE